MCVCVCVCESGGGCVCKYVKQCKCEFPCTYLLSALLFCFPTMYFLLPLQPQSTLLELDLCLCTVALVLFSHPRKGLLVVFLFLGSFFAAHSCDLASRLPQ